ncbi:ACR158Wp [Eremothecium gossypii ATCC 10895]|uniref:ACR158Wp n=1 Tax=Eremothecium gossypii (strain ATCC 10895 / CBS 109.51 / FGSC 9923 / NRRL Y-1056) TaxID=284811 RepID=Q75BW3_EREGS|nr:ACR158Wp [Eremothecium gossypii ATCC 10895]AAS51384.2 ACR158Wp [Eremothecium gossypii ATCC 10895]AEY95675.1 FACR158Wp [Eremothecium gossypii FDAG1]
MAGLDVRNIYNLKEVVGPARAQQCRTVQPAASPTFGALRLSGSPAAQPLSPTSRTMAQRAEVGEAEHLLRERTQVLTAAEWRERQAQLGDALVLDLSTQGFQLKGAQRRVHLSFPSTLLRRPNFPFSKLVRTLNSETQASLLEHLDTSNAIVLFDDGSSFWNNCLQTTITVLRKLLTYLEEQKAHTQRQVPIFLLQGGVKAFESHHFVSPAVKNGSSADKPKLTLKLCIPGRTQDSGSDGTGVTGRSALDNSSELFIQSMKGDTLHYSPSSLLKYFKYHTPAKLPKHVPPWLSPFNRACDSVLSQIMGKFELLEKLEVMRLQQCLSGSTPSSTYSQLAKTSSKLYSLRDLQKKYRSPRVNLEDGDEARAFHSKIDDSYNTLGQCKLERDIHEELNDNENKEILNKLAFGHSSSDAIEAASVVRQEDEDHSDAPNEYVITQGLNSFTKNRYSNIIPYEHTRVRLEPSPVGNRSLAKTFLQSTSHLSPAAAPSDSNPVVDHLKVPAPSSYFVKNTESAFTPLAGTTPNEPFNDYFNANYLTLPEINSKCRYIATQAPLPSTVDDFWKVITTNSVKVIISLNSDDELNLRKWDIYWGSDSVHKFNITILHSFENVRGLDGNIVRVFKVQKKSTVAGSSAEDSQSNTHIVYQIQYKKWLDSCGIVMSDFLQLYNVKNALLNDPDSFIRQQLEDRNTLIDIDEDPSLFRRTESHSPLLVHCSAGCGRTGVFITLDFLLTVLHSPLQVYNKIDVWNMEEDLVFIVVNEFRKQRISMVQNLTQYITCYESLLDFFSLHENRGAVAQY